MRILLTGASGFIGSLLLARLAERHEIFVLASPFFRAARLERWRDAYHVIRHAAEAEADVVYHLASTPLAPDITDAEHAAAIVQGTVRLCEELAASPRPPARVVFAGSAAEYGSGEGWNEADTPRPDTAFGILKSTAASLARLRLPAATQLVHPRLFTPFGEGEGAGRLIPTAIRAALEGEPVRLRTRGEERRDYVWSGDMVEALCAAGERPLAGARTVINICSGTPRRALDVVQTVLARIGVSVPIEIGAAAPAIACLSGSPARAEALLDWRASTPFEYAIDRAIRYWREELRHKC